MSDRTGVRLLACALALMLAFVAQSGHAQQGDPNDPLGLNQPLLTADQSVPNWWERRTYEWRLAPIVTTAYDNFWDIRAHALLALDPKMLQGVMAGNALAKDVAAMDTMRA